ncbi:MAG: glycosyltransferase family 2 protein, partial [Flavobacteriales bacterium]
DGRGRFLPESKRGLPTPEVAFYKVFGLSALFPRSRRFGKYHLGYLDPDEVQEIEVLSGAFMFLRRSALDQVGYLDTSFFMYGEDIDLSYRLLQGGYKNYYYPHSRIIHYKGESTKKSSINYVLVFYKAMLIFADKHFSQRNRHLFRSLIHFAIYFRAFLAILNRGVRKVALPFFDLAAIYGGAYLIQAWYEGFKGVDHPDNLVLFALAGYTGVWMLSILFLGGYDRPVRKRRIVKGVLWGTVVILVGYSLLPEDLRFSRAMVLLAALWTGIFYLGSRCLLALKGEAGYGSGFGDERRVAVVGGDEEGKRIRDLLDRSREKVRMVGIVSPDPGQGHERERAIIGNVESLSDLIDLHGIDELIFAAKDVPAQRMIDLMASVNRNVEHKVAPPESLYVIGSRSVDHSGELQMVDINSISRPENKRNKRMLDLLSVVLFFVLSPIMLCIVRSKKGFLMNLFQVLRGERTWVGYFEEGGGVENLPELPRGVLGPTVDGKSVRRMAPDLSRKLNILYAKDYRVLQDLMIILKGIRDLGRKGEDKASTP